MLKKETIKNYIGTESSIHNLKLNYELILGPKYKLLTLDELVVYMKDLAFSHNKKKFLYNIHIKWRIMRSVHRTVLKERV